MEHGFEAALYGKKREYVKEKIFDGRVESHLLSLRCEEVPDGHSGWSLRLLADKMVELEYVESISHESIRQILKKNKIKPWRVKGWIMPKKGADFVHKMEAVLDVYERPYDPTHPVICLDESPKQIISETKKSYMDSKGILHQDYEYKREGVKSTYMIVEPLGEYREVHIEDNHNSPDLRKNHHELSRKNI